MPKNKERTWIELLKACMDYNPDMFYNRLWMYATILRGPDIMEDNYHIKETFTCPLRVKARYLADIDEYERLSLEEIEETFLAIYENKNKYDHYLMHIRDAWSYFSPKVTDILDIFLAHNDLQEDKIKNLAKEYKQYVDEWLESEEIFMKE